MRRCTIPILVISLVLALAACGDGDDRAGAPAETAVAASPASPERYCTLTRELDAEGERVFAALGRDAGPSDYEAAEREFVERFDGKLTELERAAPPEIRNDVRTLLAAQRARAGLGAQVDQGDAAAAEKRLRSYERRHCPGR